MMGSYLYKGDDIMSLVEPSIDKLAEKVDSKYTLCMIAAKRACEIGDVKAKTVKKARVLLNSKSLANQDAAKRIITKVNASGKEVSVALKELENGKLDYDYLESMD